MRILKLGGLLLLWLLITAPGDERDPISIRINLAASRLDVLENGETVASFAVAIGLPRYPTPTGQFQITEVTWNPWWIPPSSDWAKGELPMPPGPSNPMGEVKMRFAP